MAKVTALEFKTYLLRFLRAVVPQIPAFITYIQGYKPEWVAVAVLIGGILTSLDKYARDKGWY
jgi:hypothetical protein